MITPQPTLAAAGPIGLYDSGIGGLSVVREVFRRLPGQGVLYVGDTARVPYGPRPASEIVAFNREIAGSLVACGARLLVVACNTSSAQALSMLESECPVPVIGLIGPGAAAAYAAARGDTRRGIAVVATEGTVRSGAYGRELRRLDPSMPVRELACPRWVPLVESGVWEGPEAEAIVAAALAPLLASPPAVLVLGCTHYPHLAPLIARVLGPGTILVDPAVRAVEAAAQRLGATAETETRPSHRFFTTGDPEPFYHLSTRLFPGCIQQVEQLRLASLCAVGA